jgi:hypothetical protein
MKHSESIKNLAISLVEAQKELKNTLQTAENPYYKSTYAPLNDILDDVRPILNKHGITVIQNLSYIDTAIVVSVCLLHISGEWIEQDGLRLPIEKQTAQSVGISVTYGRRYVLSAMLGIASEEDTDGEGENPKNTIESIKKVFHGTNVYDEDAKLKALSPEVQKKLKELKWTRKQIVEKCNMYEWDNNKILADINRTGVK